MIKKGKRPKDPNQLAKFVVDQLTADPQSQEAPDMATRKALARLLGRQGGLKGGPARKAALSEKRRSEIAKRAAQARWKDRDKGR